MTSFKIQFIYHKELTEKNSVIDFAAFMKELRIQTLALKDNYSPNENFKNKILPSKLGEIENYLKVYSPPKNINFDNTSLEFDISSDVFGNAYNYLWKCTYKFFSVQYECLQVFENQVFFCKKQSNELVFIAADGINIKSYLVPTI